MLSLFDFYAQVMSFGGFDYQSWKALHLKK